MLTASAPLGPSSRVPSRHRRDQRPLLFRVARTSRAMTNKRRCQHVYIVILARVRPVGLFSAGGDDDG
jgi:hypothetical protein